MVTDLSGGFGQVPAQGSGRRGQRAAERRRRKRGRRTVVSVLIGLAVLAVAVGGAWVGLRSVLGVFAGPADYPGPGTGEVTVVIPDGASGTVIAQKLQEKDVVKSTGAFLDAAKKDTRSTSIQPGSYSLHKQMSGQQALAALIDPANREVKKVVIREGQRVSEILAELAKATGIPQTDFEAAAKSPADLGLPPQAKNLLEGWLFPATYEIPGETTAADLLSQMVTRTTAELNDLGVPPARWHEVITAASLIQAEAGRTEDMAKISQVLHNRIAAKRPLQLDTTVNYALKQRKVKVAESQTKIKSPYNTYNAPGLPIGAIGSPGADAIKAWLNPAPGPWLYFVAVDPDSGETKFGTTEAEFWAMQKELNAWMKAHPDR